MSIQLPDDVIAKGYKTSKINKFEFDQVFHSPKLGFTGSEIDFVNAGHAYTYLQLDKFKRI